MRLCVPVCLCTALWEGVGLRERERLRGGEEGGLIEWLSTYQIKSSTIIIYFVLINGYKQNVYLFIHIVF